MKKINLLLVAALSALSLVSCSKQASLNIQGDWKVVSIEGQDVPETMNEPVLCFSEDGFTGVTGVNSLGGEFTLVGDSIHFGEAALTRMMADSVSMDVEDRFLNALQEAATVKLSDDALKLLSEDGILLMTLVRK